MKRNFVILFGFVLCTGAWDISAGQDTYTDALQNSHNTDHDGLGGGYQYNPPPDNSYLPPDNSYLPPAPTPQAPVYGPPPVPFYNSPPPVYYKPAHPIPYQAHDSILAKLKSKISLLTLGKIVLKLLIFKKIVKFIGIICLLLVLPKLKHMFTDNMSMEDEINSKHVETDKEKLQKHIDSVYDFIMSSIQAFEEETT
ncbi:hypothetical protein AWZ03_007376 [Drosophila navojoa]|uniref:Uncharacterized protein n=1 Tax=Drosophila navojoa TaxID=7232 RepID=A0A484BBS5_DRONA|nr:uncharacterized protein LOC108659861 [Drosophila navojoa]TDG46168.1 hypothetical protein AWZ03_007376 [Drosophila navojoa]